MNIVERKGKRVIHLKLLFLIIFCFRCVAKNKVGAVVSRSVHVKTGKILNHVISIGYGLSACQVLSPLYLMH